MDITQPTYTPNAYNYSTYLLRSTPSTGFLILYNATIDVFINKMILSHWGSFIVSLVIEPLNALEREILIQKLNV